MIKGVKELSGYVLGEHLPHTFSPQIHSYLADYKYGIYETSKEELGAFMTSGSFDFLNVTIPYKKDVIPYLSSLSSEAERLGAVNTVKRMSDGSLVGYNTDYYGFDYTLKKSGISVKGAKVLVLGSGGASLPIKAVLADRGAEQIITISRSGENNYQNISIHSNADVIVNTTPVGMFPKNGESPIDLSMFKSCRGVIDIIYNPERTALLLEAERLGIPCIGGLDMLVAQAKKAAEIFTDRSLDDSVVDRIVNIISFEMRNIILIGMPGCGKSSVGKILAQMTSKPFYDSDTEFETKYGITPSVAIRQYGEPKFREMEHQVICDLGSLSNAVIATGGGVVTREENYEPLHQNGKIIFIERKLENLPLAGRPISQSVGVEELYKTRYPLYMRFCDHKIVSDENKQHTIENIIKILKEGI